jgi:hypothetical protein
VVFGSEFTCGLFRWLALASDHPGMVAKPRWKPAGKCKTGGETKLVLT